MKGRQSRCFTLPVMVSLITITDEGETITVLYSSSDGIADHSNGCSDDTHCFFLSSDCFEAASDCFEAASDCVGANNNGYLDGPSL